MSFQEILKQSKVQVEQFLGSDASVERISQDSRVAESGDLFVVIPNQHDAAYFEQALKRGARAFILEKTTYEKIKNEIDLNDASFAIVHNARLALALTCTSFFKKKPHTCVAVTGTNGKSSVVHFVQQILNANQKSAASLGTLGLSVDLPQDLPNIPSLTTLDSISLHRVLDFLGEHDVHFLAMEASSHGIEQYRLHGAHLTAAAFTNLTQDHLDYHQTMDEYFLAKTKLFSEILPSGRTAVIFSDTPYSKRLLSICEAYGHKVLQYSTQKTTDIFASNIAYTIEGIKSDIHINGVTYLDVLIPLIGAFQLENVLCAIGLAIACGVVAPDIIKTLSKLQSVKGRLDNVGSYKGASIFVDYAHTPDALERVLLASRFHANGKLGLVFGCGGDRDPTKRPIMGEIAQKYADFIIVTDDNPRSENPAKIRREILQKCPQAIEIEGRGDAIETALELLDKGDILIIAGKGHETGQIVGNTVYPFDDAVCVFDYLERKK